jgi:hypothetical protein
VAYGNNTNHSINTSLNNIKMDLPLFFSSLTSFINYKSSNYNLGGGGGGGAKSKLNPKLVFFLRFRSVFG